MKAVGGVVEDGKDGRYSVLVAEARVVLVGEIQAVGEGEGGGGVGFAESPEDGTIGAGDFVDGGGVGSGDEVVAGVVFVDRIDVEVVPGEGGVKAGARRFSRVGDICHALQVAGDKEHSIIMASGPRRSHICCGEEVHH
jgi:hypothetical protein